MNDRQTPLLSGERLDEINEDLRLIAKRDGLTFGTDAYLLAAYVRKSPRAEAVDLGSGTGVIPLLLLARGKVRRVIAVEIQPEFVGLIGRNAALNGMEDRIFPIHGDVRAFPAGEDLSRLRKVSVVTANPPYLTDRSGKRNEKDEKFLARHEVCGTIADFCACAGRLLQDGGKFYCVWRPDRLTDLVSALRGAGLEPKRMTFVHADEGSEPCLCLTEAVKGARASLRVTPPLFLYEPLDRQPDRSASRVLTAEARGIYDACDFSREE